MTWSVEHVEEATSTNALARQKARGGAPDGTVVVARRQSGGRGREGRTWCSPEGGLYLSIVLRDLEDPRLLTLALGNAVADVLEVAGAEPSLKWVNDVLVDGRKIAGILVEGESTGARLDFLVAGIGINVNGDPAAFPAELQGVATTLEAAVGADQCIEDLEAFLLEEAEGWIAKLREGRGEEVLAAWRARDALGGRRVAVATAAGTVEGTARGVDDQGRLLVETGGGVEALDQGTVRAV